MWNAVLCSKECAFVVHTILRYCTQRSVRVRSTKPQRVYKKCVSISLIILKMCAIKSYRMCGDV